MIAAIREWRVHRLVCAIVVSIMSFSVAANPAVLSQLQNDHPELFSLYTQSAAYAPALDKYAAQQGFSKPVERLATVVHEMIHIASVRHQGYFINGTYYEPYLRHRAWPTLRNRDVQPHMRLGEQGTIYSVYMTSTPENSLANVLDEINAYAHVAPFVCKHEPNTADKQVRNLIGFLHVVEAYLRLARQSAPEQYVAMARDRLTSGATITIMQNAWAALAMCRVPQRVVPRLEVDAFARQVQASR